MTTSRLSARRSASARSTSSWCVGEVRAPSSSRLALTSRRRSRSSQAAPAVWTIDTFGRYAHSLPSALLDGPEADVFVDLPLFALSRSRNLLLTTFPMMSAFLLLAGLGFYAPEGAARTSVIALGVYLHCASSPSSSSPSPRTSLTLLPSSSYRHGLLAGRGSCSVRSSLPNSRRRENGPLTAFSTCRFTYSSVPLPRCHPAQSVPY